MRSEPEHLSPVFWSLTVTRGAGYSPFFCLTLTLLLYVGFTGYKLSYLGRCLTADINWTTFQMLASFLIPNLLQKVGIPVSPAKFLVWTGTELLPAKLLPVQVSQPDTCTFGAFPSCWPLLLSLLSLEDWEPFSAHFCLLYGIMDANSAFILWRGTKMIFGTKDWYRESRME